jgi:hypothetical protein
MEAPMISRRRWLAALTAFGTGALAAQGQAVAGIFGRKRRVAEGPYSSPPVPTEEPVPTTQEPPLAGRPYAGPTAMITSVNNKTVGTDPMPFLLPSLTSIPVTMSISGAGNNPQVQFRLVKKDNNSPVTLLDLQPGQNSTMNSFQFTVAPLTSGTTYLLFAELLAMECYSNVVSVKAP